MWAKLSIAGIAISLCGAFLNSTVLTLGPIVVIFALGVTLELKQAIKSKQDNCNANNVEKHPER